MPENMNTNNHVITMDQEVELMTTHMNQPPKLLHKSAGKKSCCIFRAPQGLVDINKEAYRPRIVSIGPYHYGNKDLEMIQEHKWRYLNDMITRIGGATAAVAASLRVYVHPTLQSVADPGICIKGAEKNSSFVTLTITSISVSESALSDYQHRKGERVLFDGIEKSNTFNGMANITEMLGHE